MPTDNVEYWKQRAKLAEDELERVYAGPGGGGPEPTVISKCPACGKEGKADKDAVGDLICPFCDHNFRLNIRVYPVRPKSDEWSPEERDVYYENTGLRAEALEALRLLMAEREDDDNGDVRKVAVRLINYSVEHKRALNAARRAGYPVDEHPDVAWLFDRMLSDLNSGRQTIDFLSRPPKIPIEALPVGAVFTTQDGRLLEVKRERADNEPLVTAYRWDRNIEPTTLDRKQLVQPIGRVTFNASRKQIVLGLLELSEHALAQVVVEGPKQLGGG